MTKPQPVSGIARIRAAYSGLSPKFQTIASHILDNPRDVVHLSISELAEVTGTAEATIFRLCKQLGYRGYQDLKISLAREMVDTPLHNIHEEVGAEDDMLAVANKIFHANMVGLTDTLSLLDQESLDAAVNMLNQAKRVELYGLGGSTGIVWDAYHKFMRTGLNCIAQTDAHMQVMCAAMLEKDSVVLGISHSGSNKDILEAFRVAKCSGAKLIAITSYRKSPLSQMADVSLYTATQETAFRTEAMSSRIAQLCILDTLYVGLSLLRQEETVANLQKIREVISLKRM